MKRRLSLSSGGGMPPAEPNSSGSQRAEGMLEEMPEDMQSKLNASQTMAVRDALPSLEIIQENCLAKMASLDEWQEQTRTT